MSSKGTDVYLRWNNPKQEQEIWAGVERAVAFLVDTIRDEHKFYSPEIGAFYIGFRKNTPDGLITEGLVEFKECDVLPELAIIDRPFMKGEVASLKCYHFAKKLFLETDADLCCGTARADEVPLYDFADSFIDRAFRFTKLGPQKLILPFEENRPIIDTPLEANGYSDTQFNPSRGEANWVLRLDGPLRQRHDLP